MMSTDFAALSRSHPFGTARVMGMGGAFTSLGADLSSMSINPAGLGSFGAGTGAAATQAASNIMILRFIHYLCFIVD